MKFRKSFITVFLLLLAFLHDDYWFKVAAQDEIELSETATITDSAGGTISINYPDGWTVADGLDGTGTFVLTGADGIETLTILYVAEPFAVALGDSPEDVLEVQAESLEEAIENQQGSRLSDIEEIEIGDYPAASMTLSQGSFDTVYYVVAIDESYVIAYAFETDEELVEAIILSLSYSTEAFELPETASVQDAFGSTLTVNYPEDWDAEAPHDSGVIILEGTEAGQIVTITFMPETYAIALGQDAAAVLQTMTDPLGNSATLGDIVNLELDGREAASRLVTIADVDTLYYVLSADNGYVYANAVGLDAALLEAILITASYGDGSDGETAVDGGEFGLVETTSAQDVLGGTISLNYPSGWTVVSINDPTGAISLIGENGEIVTIAFFAEALNSSFDSPAEILEDIAAESATGSSSVGEIVEGELDGNPTAMVVVTTAGMELINYVMETDEGFIFAASTGIDIVLLEAILLTVTYSAE